MLIYIRVLRFRVETQDFFSDLGFPFGILITQLKCKPINILHIAVSDVK